MIFNHLYIVIFFLWRLFIKMYTANLFLLNLFLIYFYMYLEDAKLISTQDYCIQFLPPVISTRDFYLLISFSSFAHLIFCIQRPLWYGGRVNKFLIYFYSANVFSHFFLLRQCFFSFFLHFFLKVNIIFWLNRPNFCSWVQKWPRFFSPMVSSKNNFFFSSNLCIIRYNLYFMRQMCT